MKLLGICHVAQDVVEKLGGNSTHIMTMSSFRIDCGNAQTVELSFESFVVVVEHIRSSGMNDESGSTLIDFCRLGRKQCPAAIPGIVFRIGAPNFVEVTAEAKAFFVCRKGIFPGRISATAIGRTHRKILRVFYRDFMRAKSSHRKSHDAAAFPDSKGPQLLVHNGQHFIDDVRFGLFTVVTVTPPAITGTTYGDEDEFRSPIGPEGRQFDVKGTIVSVGGMVLTFPMEVIDHRILFVRGAVIRWRKDCIKSYQTSSNRAFIDVLFWYSPSPTGSITGSR